MHFVHDAFRWPGLRVLDVQPYVGEEWGVLTEDGRLLAMDAHGTCRLLAPIRLAPVDPAERVSLHLSADGRFAAVAARFGRYGKVIDLEAGRETFALDRQDYHENHCVHSLAFFEHGRRTLLVHATDWNRLDVIDPATGESQTPREPVVYSREQPSPHYLDYFHAGLSVSPDGRWIADNGWLWHPLGVVRTWSLADWIERNPWESEDGPSVRELCAREYYWDGPWCWVDDTTLAVWGAGEDVDELLPAARLFDVTTGKEIRTLPGPDIAPHNRVTADGAKGWMTFDDWLFAISPEHGTGVWDIESGERVHLEPGFVPRRYHPQARSFLSLRGDEMVSSRLV